MLRIFAIGCVVMIHVVNAVFARPDFFGGISWWLAIILNSIARVGVPLFIMISGYFILQKEETYKDTLKRTVQRLVVPFLVWFLIYLLWNGGYPSLFQLNETVLPRLIAVNVFDLYFFLILIGLYLISPILRSFLKNTKENKMNIMWFLLGFGCLSFFCQYLFFLCSPGNIFTYFLPYTGLFVAGYVLGMRKEKFTLGLPLYLLGLFVTVIGSYAYFLLINQGNQLLSSHGCLSYYTDSYLSINVVLMTVAVFLLGIHWRAPRISERFQKTIYLIARSSLGIYLIHTLFLDIFDSRLHLFDHIHPAWLYIIVKLLVLFGLSAGTAIGLMKVPIVKKAFGETR